MGNAVIHFELMSKEPEKVSAFYSKVFDWNINHVPEINYRIVETGAEGEMHGINGGIVKPDKPGPWPGNRPGSRCSRRSPTRPAATTSRTGTSPTS